MYGNPGFFSQRYVPQYNNQMPNGMMNYGINPNYNYSGIYNNQRYNVQLPNCNNYGFNNGYNLQNYQNNIYNNRENGLENGIPNSQRINNNHFTMNNLNNNNNQNNQMNQIRNNKNQTNNQNIQNNNHQNIKKENGGNIENGQLETNKEEKQKTNDELILDYENKIRKEIEKSTPLISEDYNINVLIDDYHLNQEYLTSIKNISKKYKYIRKVIRDGNCFYRAFIFRLFEHICIKNDKILFEKIKQKIISTKELTEKNGYDWAIVEDFYNLFLKEFTNCFNSLTYENTVRDYLDTLFCEREKGNYLIYFIRFCIAAYLKENKESYQMYIDDSFDDWVRKEVEAIDHEADQIQIMACVNYFDVGVKIEYLNKNQSEVVKLPYDKPDNQFFIFLLFTPGHYDILYP